MSSKLENDEIAAEAKYPSELFELSSIPRKESISSGGPVVHLVESNENPEPMEEAIELSPSKEELAATDNEALDGDVDGNANETGKGTEARARGLGHIVVANICFPLCQAMWETKILSQKMMTTK